MGKKEMPAIGRKRNVSRREGGNKMILCRPDCPFRGVGTVVSGWDVLEMDARSGLMEKISQVFLTRLIVENEMSEGMGMGREEGACRLKGRDVGRRSA